MIPSTINLYHFSCLFLVIHQTRLSKSTLHHLSLFEVASNTEHEERTKNPERVVARFVKIFLNYLLHFLCFFLLLFFFFVFKY